jgi:NAD(P)-dependent dehydrogenase (short-subunit alcohol dehydrogenase family)
VAGQTTIRLDASVAIVTGAAQGIGAAYAKGLAAAGAKVCVADILDPGLVVAAIEEAGGAAIGTVTDVSDAKACRDMVAATVAAFGGLDVLVSNAAVFAGIERKSFLEIDPDEWDRLMAVNVRGVFCCAKAAVPKIRKRGGGSIINIASDTVLSGVPMMLHYVSSKGAVIAMTRAMARELGDDNIRVNFIAPGLTMSEAIASRRDEFAEGIARSLQNRALKRDEVPDDLVGTLLFLASADSAFITGQTLVVNGGSSMH